LSESIRRIHIRPTLAGANMGHPSGFVWFFRAGFWRDGLV
jgi:hypothetical protein